MLDNNVVVGVQASSGYLPGLTKFGPSGYNFASTDVKLGYQMGALTPYVIAGYGVAKANGIGGGGFTNSGDALNNLFASHGPEATLAHVGAGFDYAVNNNLTIGVAVQSYQARGFGPLASPP